MRIYDLTAMYDTRKSFYSKAKILVAEGAITLLSYDTPVARIKDDIFEINSNVSSYLLYSNTTLRHIKEFYKQFVENIEVKKSDLKKFEVNF